MTTRLQDYKTTSFFSRDVSMIPINLTNIEASNELRVRSDCRDASNQSGIRSFFVKFRVILWKNIFRR